MPQRIEPEKKFSTMEMMVAVMVGRGLEYPDIGSRLSITARTVKMHAQNASAKLPGKDPPQMKLRLWWRGAPLEVMAPESGDTSPGGSGSQ